MKYQIIHNTLTKSNCKLTVSQLCILAGVSRSGYYAWIKNLDRRLFKEEQDKKDFELILQAYTFKNRYKGARGIKMVLFRQYGIQMNLKKIRRLMKKYHLSCPIRRANPYRKIGKAIKSHTVKNLLERNFDQGIPGKVLLTDITYIYYALGKCVYLSTIKDGCTRQISAYHLSQEMTTDLVTDTIHILKNNQLYQIKKDALFHSDQGSQYTSDAVRNLLKDENITQSMSRRGNCWDNAPQESFYGHMKDELHLEHCQTFWDLKDQIDEYMEYYNNYRYQWELKQMSPDEYYTYLLTGLMPY